MVGMKNGRGLCSTCNNSPSCFYRGSRGPALFCELFDDYVPPVVRSTVDRGSPPVEAPVTLTAAEHKPIAYTGLCMNCDNRQTCVRSRSGESVWHCENYT